MIRRSDFTVFPGTLDPRPSVHVTVKDADGDVAVIYNDDGSAKGNPFLSGLDGSFSYNVINAGNYTEEYRISAAENPVRVFVISLGLSFLGDQSVFLPENYGALGNTSVTPNGNWSIGTSDKTAVEACLAAIVAAGGGTMLCSRLYNIPGNLDIPNNEDPNGVIPNTDGGVPTQPTIRITSASSAFASGQQDGSAPSGCGGLVFTGGTGGDTFSPARINTHGRGLLHFDKAVLCSVGEAAADRRPFVFTSNTTVWMDGCTVWTEKTAANACDDILVCGGRTIVFGQRAASPFQGYGSRVWGCFFNGVRAIKLQTYANKVIIRDNTWWARCGAAAAYAADGPRAAISIDGHATDAADQYAVGTVVSGNLIEMPGFVYGVHLDWASHAMIDGNDCYDEGVGTVSTVYLGTNTSNNIVISALAPAAMDYLTGPGKGVNNTFIGSYESEASNFPTITSGRSGYPNQFADTTFTSIQNRWQPTDAAAANGVYRRMVRPVGAAAQPNTDVKLEYGNGFEEFGEGATQGGNRYVHATLTGVPEWYNGGKAYGFGRSGNVRAGAAMEVDTGSGGSPYTIKSSTLDISTHAGAAGALRNAGLQILGARKTGWAVASGTATRTTFDTATVTLPQLAERVKALIDDFHATAGHGAIGP